MGITSCVRNNETVEADMLCLEETIRCNIKIRRLHTSIVDKGRSFDKILAQSAVLGPIHGAIRDFITQRTHINNRLLHKISKIYDLEGFSGTVSPGVRQVSGTFFFFY